MSIRGKEILIIDDDPDVRRIISKILSNVGIVVAEAGNVKEALSSVQKRRPHLILLDLQMSPDTGYVFLEACKNQSICKGIPVIVVSGLNDRSSIAKAFTFGAKDYLMKPLNATLLLQKIRKLFIRSGDDSFLKVDFPIADAPTMTVTVPSILTAINDIGLQIRSPIRLSQEERVRVTTPVLTENQLDSVLQKSGPEVAKTLGEGQFMNEIRFIGISYQASLKIRSIIKRWS